METMILEQPEIVSLSPKEKICMQRLASSRRRSTFKHLDNMDEIHRDVMEALIMSDQAKNGYFQPIISIPTDLIDESVFYKNLNDFTSAEIFFTFNERKFHSTLSENKWKLDDKKRMNEIENTQKEMSRAAKIMDMITFQRNQKNKKKEE